MHLYPWQQEALTSWQNNHFQGIVHVVTGAGKTVFALACAARLEQSLPSPLRVKIVVPTIPLASQWASAIRRFSPCFGISQPGIGYYHGRQKDDSHQPYMIYVINSARYALARHITADLKNGCHVLLIADECHHYASPENRRIFDFLYEPNGWCFDIPISFYHSLGLSATPQSPGYDTVLVPALGKEIYRYGFASAIRAGNICGFSIYQIALSFTAGEWKEYDDLTNKMASIYSRLANEYPYLKKARHSSFFAILGRIAADEGTDFASLAKSYLTLSYQRKSISSNASARISCVLDLIGQLDRQGFTGRILIFGERISQACQVSDALALRYPSQVGCYHSEMSPLARKNTLSSFRDGSLRILVSCRALDEGLDVPDTAIGIVLSGSSASRQKIQRLGRILRQGPGKPSPCLYYLYIKESSDDSAFLPDQEEAFPVCNLSYCAGDHSFTHPAYENAAAHILKKAADNGISKELQKEIRLCLLAGLVRPDWLNDAKECDRRIRQANTTREKNYWISMKWMVTSSGDQTYR